MTTFADLYHPALGNVHISVPNDPTVLSLYESHGWVLSTGGGPDPTPIDLTVGLGDLRYAKLGDIPTPGTATGDALRAAFGRLIPTATKTAAYTAAVGELAMMNVAGGATALTLPTAPADNAQVGYRAIGATPAVPLTVNRGGTTDSIGTTGATSVSLPMADEIAVLQYDAANTRWLAVSAVKTQASLDLRYGRADPVLASFVYDGSGNLTSYTEDGIAITLTYNADGTVATSTRGTDATQTYTYSGGNLSGVA